MNIFIVLEPYVDKRKKKPYMISNGRRWFIILYPSVPLPPNAIQPDGLYYALDWDRVT